MVGFDPLPRVRGVLDAPDYGLADEVGRLEARGYTVDMDPWGAVSAAPGRVEFPPDAAATSAPAGGRARLEWLLEHDKAEYDLIGAFPGMRRAPVVDRGGPAPEGMPVAYEPRVAQEMEFGPDESLTAAAYQRGALTQGAPEGLAPPLPPQIDAALDADAARASTRIAQREEQRTTAWNDVYAWRALSVEERQLRTPLTDAEKTLVREQYDKEIVLLEDELRRNIDFTSPTLISEITAKFMAEQRVARLPDALIAETKLARIRGREGWEAPPPRRPGTGGDNMELPPEPGEKPLSKTWNRVTKTPGTSAKMLNTGYDARRERELANREAALKPSPETLDIQRRAADEADRLTEQDQQARQMSDLEAEATSTGIGPAPTQYTDTSPYDSPVEPAPLFNPDAEGAGLPDIAYMDTRPRSRYEAQLIDDAKAYRMRDPLRARTPDGGTLYDAVFRLQPGDVDSTIGFDAPTRDALDIETLGQGAPEAGIRIDELREEAVTRFIDIHGRRPRRSRGNKEAPAAFAKSDLEDIDGKPGINSLMREIMNDLRDPTPTSPRGITAEDWSASGYIEGQEFFGFDAAGADYVYYNPDVE